MTAVVIRKLETENEMKQYSEGYWDAFNGRITRSVHPIDPQILLKKYDRVMGVFKGDRMVGGFIVNLYPHRCFDGLTKEQIEFHTAKLGGIDQCGELVAIWKVKEFKSFSSKVWPRIIIESLRLGKKNIFGSVYTSNKIKDTYSVLNPHHVTTVGDSKPLEIFYYERYRIVGTFFANAIIRSMVTVGRALKLIPPPVRYKNA